MLKRKNEEDNDNEQAKRVALDAEVQDASSEGPGATDELKRISSHKVVNDDPTYTHFRMLCQVKEAALVVGKGGEKISHIKKTSETRINVSENIRGIMERVIHVRGSSENVAKAFGLITRAIVDEEEGVPSDAGSKQFNLVLLVPHNVIGYVIGKQGTKFREIEDKSAAKLNASPQSLPFSTDRCLTINGVADAIHIATYYVAQTILEHKSHLKGQTIFYDPAHNSQGASSNPMMMNNMMPYGALAQMNQHQYGHFGNGNAGVGGPGRYPNRQGYMNPVSMAPISLPLPGGVGQQVTQEIYIPNEYVGNVIGKNGKSISQIKEASGSKVLIGDPEENSKERKITLVGTSIGNQSAIYLINNKIESDKRNNEMKARNAQKEQENQEN